MHAFPVEIMKELSRQGFLAMTIPEEYGGLGLDPISYASAMRILSRADAGVSVAVSVTNMVAEAINRFGNDQQKNRYLRAIASGEILAGAFGLTEPNAGSNPVQMKTTAVRRDEEGKVYRIRGEKVFITSGDQAGIIILFAKTDPEKAHHGITAFILEKGVQGLHIGKKESKLGLWSSSTVSLVLDEVEAGAEQILGNPGDGFKIAMSALDSGRIGIASQAVGIAEAALDDLMKLAHEKEEWKTIINAQGFQFEIADLFTKLEASRLLIYQAGWKKQAGVPFTREASMAKYFASEVAQEIVSRVVRLAQWAGISQDFSFEQYYRDVRVTSIYEGTSEIQKLVIARKILEQFEK